MIRAICDPLEVQRKVRLFPTEMIKGTSLKKLAFELRFEGHAHIDILGRYERQETEISRWGNVEIKAEKHRACASNFKGLS